MSFSHEYNFPLFVSTGKVLTSGGSDALAAGQMGVFNGKTYQAVSGIVDPKQPLFLAQGSYHSKDKLGLFVGGLKQSDKTIQFLAKDILSFERSKPRRAQSEQWILGWDGTNACGSFQFFTGKTYRFLAKVWGEDVYGTFLKPLVKEIQVSFAPSADGVPVAVGTKYGAQKLAEAFNADPELKYFAFAEAIHDDYAATTATHESYQLTIADDGSQTALAAVQSSYPTKVVTKVARTGIYSTYEFWQPVADSAPADFTAAGSIALADCGVCPAGFTAVSGSNVYAISRPLAGTEDLTTTGAQQTYADSIGTAYEAATKLTFNGATAVDPATDKITFVGHGLVTGDKITYSNGGGTSITGLTSGNDYFIIKSDVDNVKLATTFANAIAGTAVDITADGVGAAHLLTPVSSAKFLSNNGAVAVVELKVPAGVELTALSSDSAILVRREVAQCTPPAGSAVAWVLNDTQYKKTKEYCITLPKVCGTQDRLAELQAAYAGNTKISTAIAIKTAGTCTDTYSVSIYSDNLLDDACLSEDIPVFTPLQSFDGFVWDVCPCVDESTGSTSVKSGVRITAAYESTKFGSCSFNPADYYSVRPLKLEITELTHGVGQDDNGTLPVAPIPSRKVRNASMSTQSGEWLIREKIKADKYRLHGEWYHDPRLREVMDNVVLDIIDRDKRYVAYFLKVMQDRSGQNHVADYSPEIYEFVIAIPEGVDPTSLESTIGAVAASAGVYLKDR